MKNILITGGAGYIGTASVQRLRRCGYRISVIDNLSRGFKTHAHSDIEFHEIDLIEKAKVEAVFKECKFDAIIHLAALAYVKESVEQPERYLKNNIESTKNILELADKYKVPKLIFSSSSTVYGNSPGRERALEMAETAPMNPYGESKIVCEELIKKSGLSYLILRYFNVAGADIENDSGLRTDFASHLIHVLARAACSREAVTVYGNDYETEDGSCVRDYIHVSDIALIHELGLKYLTEENKPSLTLNCGYGEGYSVHQIIRAFERNVKTAVEVRSGPRRPGDPNFLVSDNRQLKETLGWQSLFDDPLHAICTSSYHWEKKMSPL